MRYSLRTLLIVLALGPMVFAAEPPKDAEIEKLIVGTWLERFDLVNGRKVITTTYRSDGTLEIESTFREGPKQVLAGTWKVSGGKVIESFEKPLDPTFPKTNTRAIFVIEINGKSLRYGLSRWDVHPSTKTKWPASMDGKYVPKTFRFKPSSIEYRPQSTRGPSTLVIFGIKSQDIPADYFTVGYRNGSDEEKRVKRAIEEDDGYITVVSTWVNGRRPREDWKGSPDMWIDGRALLGILQ